MKVHMLTKGKKVLVVSDLERRFRAFHQANPDVYEKVKEFALQACATTAPKVSMVMIVERIKWSEMFEAGEAPKAFTLNKDYYAAYARMFLKEHPQHADRFELRASGFGR